MTGKQEEIQAMSVRFPEPLYAAIKDIASYTGRSMNLTVVQACEQAVDQFHANLNSVSSALTSTLDVQTSASLRATYGSSSRWSSQGGTALSKWTSTEEEKRTDG